MQPTSFKTAWEHPGTPSAWFRTVLFRCGVALCWFGAFVGLWVAADATPRWALWVWVPLMFIIIYGVTLGIVGTMSLLGIRRVLRLYPWQVHTGAAQTAKNGTTRFVLPNPERPEKTVTLRMGDYLGSNFRFWIRGVRAGRVKEVWFAGDPRFVGVIATPGPRRLIRPAQPEALNPDMSPRKRGVSPEALERARRAGARTG
ncbi:hypothetical protein [Streptomyces sp. NPDC003077]|uniref:hypothetical protein n=1 Tax=Streptomyces sp. NPDC003077 TaxID=3154443 RepID=UPI0033ACFF85